MPQGIIVLQPERTITLAISGTFVQESSLAANVLPYLYIVPFIRVIKAPENNVDLSTGLTFTFQTAPLLATPDDETVKGYRWGSDQNGVDIAGYSIPILNVAAANAGFTKYSTAVNGAVPMIVGVGGLLRYKIANGTTQANTLRFEIHLVGRGP